jgi:hypothetical protein
MTLTYCKPSFYGTKDVEQQANFLSKAASTVTWGSEGSCICTTQTKGATQRVQLRTIVKFNYGSKKLDVSPDTARHYTKTQVVSFLT